MNKTILILFAVVLGSYNSLAGDRVFKVNIKDTTIFNDQTITIDAELEPQKKNGSIKWQRWEQVDGSPLKLSGTEDKQLKVANASVGEYRLKLTAQDSENNEKSDEARLVVVNKSDYTFTPADTDKFHYSGRFHTDNPSAPEMGWPGASVTFWFNGTSAIVKLKAGSWPTTYNGYYAIIDDSSTPYFFETSDQRHYLIANGLKKKKHKVQIYRLTGAWTRSTSFEGVYTDGKVLKPQAKPKRRIEFYGDSITAGAFMEGYGTNNYHSFAGVTARLLKAEPSFVCKGGLGLVEGGYAGGDTLPKIYNRIMPWNDKFMYDFSSWTPHVVVVNILQNDVWLQNFSHKPDSEYREAYVTMIKTLRKKRPKAHIFCILGSMDVVKTGSKWPGLVSEAVKIVRNETGDKKLHTHFFKHIGGKNHPSREQAQTMGKELSGVISSVKNIWKN